MVFGCAFLALIVAMLCVLVIPTAFAQENKSSTSEDNSNPVLEQAQKSLEANQKKLATGSPPPPTVVQSAVQEISGTSMLEGVEFTWVIILDTNEVSVNLRYDGDGSTPQVNVAASALAKSVEGQPVTLEGNSVLNAGWISPYTLNIPMNGDSTLYDSTSINVVASPSGSFQSLPNTPPATETDENKITTSTPQAGVLKVLSSNSFIDDLGYLHVVGEIENGTPDSIPYVKATGTFYDKNNKVVATDFTFTSPSDLGPGDKAPFEIILTSASVPISQIDHHNIIASHD